jgi:hypothetical protein
VSSISRKVLNYIYEHCFKAMVREERKGRRMRIRQTYKMN